MHDPNLTRRGLMIAATAGVSLAAAGVTGAVSPTPASPLVTSRPDLVAVRVFPSYRDTVYAQHDAVLARLAELGVRRISHKITPRTDPATVLFTQRAYWEHGIRSWLTVGEPRVPLTEAQWDSVVALLEGPLAGMVERCYGWNEPNHVRGGGSVLAGWQTMTAAHQTELWRRVAPLGILVGTPQLWSGDLEQHDADLATLAPAIAGAFDHIAWHLYPRGDVGLALLDRFDTTYRAHLGSYPVVCTEAGYFTAEYYTGGAQVVTEAVQASLLPMLIDAYVSRGYGLSLFELLDDPDPSGANREARLGLIRCPSLDPATWSPKPSFLAVSSHLT